LEIWAMEVVMVEAMGKSTWRHCLTIPRDANLRHSGGDYGGGDGGGDMGGGDMGGGDF